VERPLAELREDWARKKARYEELLHTYFPPTEPGEPLPPLEPVPPGVMAELERLEKEMEKARLLYVSALLYGKRG
jgi:hypothetical protein